MHPYHVDISNSVDLYQLNDGRFQLTKNGSIDPIMVGFRYILLKNSIADSIKELGVKGVSFKPAIIWDRQSNYEDNSYMQMNVDTQLNSDSIGSINLHGTQFLLMDERYLFVTPELKAKLELSSVIWEFSHAFSNFG